MSVGDEYIILEGQDAIDLWLEGKDAWNDWVEKNPIADVYFSGVDFAEYRDHPTIEEDKWPFALFVFPTGYIGLDKVSFGDGMTNFSETSFGDGLTNFTDASFGKGGTTFFAASFGKGGVVFNNAAFGEGKVAFVATSFGEGDVGFSGASFSEGKVSFLFVDFKGRAIFSNLQNVGAVEGFSFADSTFQSSLNISSEEPFGCVLDLTNTRMSNQTSLEDVQCNLRKIKSLGLIRQIDSFMRRGIKRKFYRPLIRYVWTSEWLCKAKARDEKDIERFRRLKEIAGNNKNHDQALNFNVMEMQAKRWHNTTKAGLVFEFLFQKASDYGRSEFYPFMWMLFFWSIWAGIYYYLSDCLNNDPIKKIWTAATFSVGQMVSFVPISRDARSDGAELLFPGDQLPNAVIWLASAQSLISIILIFLIGLSLRNRFKV